MNLEIKDELESFSKQNDLDYKNEISDIIKLFRFSNLNLLISNSNGEIVFGSSSFCNLTGFYIKELARENIESILNKKFAQEEIFEIEREPECFSAMRILKTKNGNAIRVNTYNTILREFFNTYIVTIVIPSPVM